MIELFGRNIAYFKNEFNNLNYQANITAFIRFLIKIDDASMRTPLSLPVKRQSFKILIACDNHSLCLRRKSQQIFIRCILGKPCLNRALYI